MDKSLTIDRWDHLVNPPLILTAEEEAFMERLFRHAMLCRWPRAYRKPLSYWRLDPKRLP